MSDDYTLVLEGATYVGSVALLRGSTVVAERTLGEDDGSTPRSGKGERLMPAIAECFSDAGIAAGGGAVVRIVCGAGPGSFTSLRVAGSVAKGLAAGWGIDLYAVSSLMLTVAGAKPPLPSGEYLSVLDAMRGEFYATRISLKQGLPTEDGAPTLISTQQLEDYRGSHSLKVIGPGQPIDAGPHARGAAAMLETIVAGAPVDLASWEPDYGRLAEAQVRWEAIHGRKLVT
jgi:tRNA threonylcarbamoyladenosine biosynthesis protein TsaB